MIQRISATPSFEKAIKKLHLKDKTVVDIAVRAVAAQPAIGTEKKGDLAGVYVYKFKINKQEMLMSYQMSCQTAGTAGADAELVLLALGSHENFYQKLKR